MSPVDLIVSAIATQEGFFKYLGHATLPQVRNNPGDLRYMGQIGASAPGWNKIGVPPVATFSDLPHGVAALYRQVWLWVAQGKTLRDIVMTQDAATVTVYLANVQEWTGLPADTPILDLLPALQPAYSVKRDASLSS
jgi:hypothetical protein